MDISVLKETIRNSVDIEDLFTYLGIFVTYEFRKGEIRCGCPIHGGEDPNFSFDIEKGIWTCFSHGCGEDLVSRDVFSLVQVMTGCSFMDSLRILAELSGVDIDNSKYDKKASDLLAVKRWIKTQKRLREKRDVTPINEKVVSAYRKKQHEYIASRGFSKLIIDRFEIGYSDSGQFYNRVIFPIRDEDGNLVGFSGRLATDNPDELNKYGKYRHLMNFSKGAVLYGLNFAKGSLKAHNNTLIITEGFFDVMRAHEFGAINTVGVMGTKLSKDQLRLVLKYATNVILAFDNDAKTKAGQKATMRIARQLEPYCRIRILQMPEDMDIDKLDISTFWDLHDNAITLNQYRRSFSA